MNAVERKVRFGCIIWWMASYAVAESLSQGPTTTEYDTRVLHVSWRAVPNCGDAQTVTLLVQELLGNDEIQASQRQSNAVFEVSKTLRGYSVRMTFSEGIRVGRRTFSAESCEAVIDASTLVLAVAVQPNMRWEAALARLAELRTRLSRPPSPQAIGVLPDIEPEPTVPPPTLPASPVPILTSTRNVQSAKRSTRSQEPPCNDEKRCKKPTVAKSSALVRVHVAASTVIDTATLPSWSGGFRAGVGADYAPVFVDVSGLFLLPRNATLPDDSTRGAALQLIGGQARLCAASPRAPSPMVFARPCAGTLLAAISGEPFGLHARNRIETFVAATFGIDAELRVHRDLTLVGGLTAIVPIRRVSLVVDGIDTALHRTPSAAQLSLGVRWAF